MLQMFLYSLLLCCLMMSVIWLIQLKTKNAGIVDIAWSYNFPLVALICFFIGDGYYPRRVLIATMVVIWGLRLGTHLLVRVAGHIKEEDGRYKQLRTDWAANLNYKFFMFFQLQAVLNVLLSIPFIFICLNTSPEITWLEWTGAGLWCVALLGEALADWQLQHFKRNPLNKGKVCNVGLWKYSRHPNYFFEWLIWVAYFITALSSSYGWISLICPVLMLHFLYRVTGIPMTEEQSIRSKGDAYREYQKTTSAFVPWFNK